MTSRSSCKSQGPRQRPPIVEGESYHSSCSSSGIVLGGKGGGGSANPVDKGGGKRGLARFSLRRLLYSSPLVGRRSGGISSRGRGEGGMFALGALSSRQQLQQALAAVVGGGALGGDGHSDARKRDVEKGSAGTRHTAKGTEARWGKPSRATRVSSSRKDAKSKNPSGAKSKSVSLVEDTSSVLQVEDEELGSVMVEVSLNNEGLDAREVECPLCLSNYPPEYFPVLGTCMHRSCYDCFQRYLRIEISASRVAVACPQCSEPMHPNDIRMILNDRALYEKYEDFMVRRVLAVDPDTRWCPAPDCGFAVIASGCASCPRLKCERPGCGAHFCYHCRAPWHPDQTCDAARLERSQSPSYLHFHPHHHHSHHHHHGGNNPSNTSSAAPSSSSAASSSSGASSSHGPGPLPNSSSTSSHHRVHSSSSASFGMGDSERGHHSHHHHRDDIKPCPRCQVLIVKMDDGSCNHMTCAVCGAEFCWLCMKLISDLHYLSPSGCTFWGKKPWSRKKKILWQLGTLVGAPVGIGLLAGIAVPAMIIGIPVWVGRKLYARYEQGNRHRRNLAIAGGVTASIVVSPVLAGLAVGIGVPILLFYVYGVVPVSLCRSGGCGVSTSPAGGVRFDFDEGDGGVVGVGSLGGGISGPQTPGGDGSSTHGLLGRSGGPDTASVDTSIHQGVGGGGGVGVGVGTVGNPSIGEASLSLGSGSQLERLGRDDEEDEEEVRQGGESGSNAALAGASLAGSIASSLLPGGQRLEVQADVVAAGSCSMSSSGRGSAGGDAVSSRDGGGREGAGGQRLSVSSSGSCTSGGVILGGIAGEKEDKCPSSKSSSAVDEGSSTGGASTRALAGSITLNFKMGLMIKNKALEIAQELNATDSSSLYHFRESPEEDWSLDGGGMSEGECISNPAECTAPTGHGMHRRNLPAPTSHPVSSARKCTARRPPMDREGSDSSSWTGGEDGASSDRVRFDDHVRFIGGTNTDNRRHDTPSPLAQASTPPRPLRSSSLSLQHAPSGGAGSGLASSASSGPALTGAGTRKSGPHLPWSRSQSVGEMPVPSTSTGTAALQASLPVIEEPNPMPHSPHDSSVC